MAIELMSAVSNYMSVMQFTGIERKMFFFSSREKVIFAHNLMVFMKWERGLRPTMNGVFVRIKDKCFLIILNHV